MDEVIGNGVISSGGSADVYTGANAGGGSAVTRARSDVSADVDTKTMTSQNNAEQQKASLTQKVVDEVKHPDGIVAMDILKTDEDPDENKPVVENVANKVCSHICTHAHKH
jgi:hypothetical protein